MTPALGVARRAVGCSPIFAHPDDESLACGGTLAMCAAEGRARLAALRDAG